MQFIFLSFLCFPIHEIIFFKQVHVLRICCQICSFDAFTDSDVKDSLVPLFKAFGIMLIHDTLELVPSYPFILEPVREKTNKLGSNQVRHKLGCTVIEDG